MALIFMDSFDYLQPGLSTIEQSAIDQRYIRKNDTGSVSNWADTMDNDRYGNTALRVRSEYRTLNVPVSNDGSSVTEIIFGLDVYIPENQDGLYTLFLKAEGDTTPTAIFGMNNQFKVAAFVDGAWQELILAPHTGELRTWYYYEFHVRLGNPGYVKIVRDGTAVLYEDDTINLADGKAIEYIVCRGDGPGNDADMAINDLYVCDTTGTRNNQILGFPKIKTIVPTANGTVNDFSPLSGTGENWEEVNKIPSDGDASYTFVEAAAGLRDQYKFSPTIGTDRIIHGIQPTSLVRMAAENPGNRVKVRSVLDDTSTVVEGDVGVINSSTDPYTVVSDTIEADSQGNFWVNATIVSSEFGIELVGAV